MKILSSRKKTIILCMVMVVLLGVFGALMLHNQRQMQVEQNQKAQLQVDEQLLNSVEKRPNDMLRSVNVLAPAGGHVLVSKTLTEHFWTDSDHQYNVLQGSLTILEKTIKKHHLIGVVLESFGSFQYLEDTLSIQGYLEVRVGGLDQTFEQLSLANGHDSPFVQAQPGAPLSYWLDQRDLPDYSRLEANWAPEFLGDQKMYATSGGPSQDLFAWVSTSPSGFDVGYGPHDPIRRCSFAGEVDPSGNLQGGEMCNY